MSLSKFSLLHSGFTWSYKYSIPSYWKIHDETGDIVSVLQYLILLEMHQNNDIT